MSSCDFMAGWIGGCAGIIVGHPLDTLKVYQRGWFNLRGMYTKNQQNPESNIVVIRKRT